MIKQTILSLSLLLTIQQAQANDFIAGALVLGAITLVQDNHRHSNHSHQPPVVIIQPPERSYERPEAYQSPRYISPNRLQRNQFEPPVYDRRNDWYIYTVPDYYDNRLGRWVMKDNKIYVPSSRHFAGCNFYDYKEAEICVRINQDILNRSGVVIQ